MGNQTRYPSPEFVHVRPGAQTLSYTRSGAPIPAEKSPRRLYKKLSCKASADQCKANVAALQRGQSILDFVGDQSKRP